ncbi:MAG: hypothetical protein AAF909_03415 [Pseudomonadota bacterium]
MKKSVTKKKAGARPTGQAKSAARVKGPGAADAAASKPSQKPAAQTSRRDMLRGVRDYGLIALGVGGVGYWIGADIVTQRWEQDLTRIGDGSPAIVQVHDPNCPECAALQSAVRTALAALEAEFGADRLTYLVANITTQRGRAFANSHGVRHVTLVLLDGEGARRQVITGVQSAQMLRGAFETHLRRYGRG